MATKSKSTKPADTTEEDADAYLDAIMNRRRAEQKEIQKSQGGNFKIGKYGFFKMEDKEKRRIRILTDIRRVPVITCHNTYDNRTNTGGLIYCAGQFGLDCSLCNTEIPDDVDDEEAKRLRGIKRTQDIYVLFHFDYDELKKEYTSKKDDKKTYKRSPLKVFHRTPGRDGVNHDKLADLEAEYKGLNSRDFRIVRNGEGVATTYDFMALDREPFELPDNVDEAVAKDVEALLEAARKRDYTFLYQEAITTVAVPDGAPDFPPIEEHWFIKQLREAQES